MGYGLTTQLAMATGWMEKKLAQDVEARDDGGRTLIAARWCSKERRGALLPVGPRVA